MFKAWDYTIIIAVTLFIRCVVVSVLYSIIREVIFAEHTLSEYHLTVQSKSLMF